MYQEFYNLNGKPFQLTPDAAMLFPSKGHKRAMSYLLYGLEQGEGFVMITGAVGTGKTLLIQKLLEEVADRNVAVASIASANLNGEDILPAVASAFDLPYESRSKEALLQELRKHLIGLHGRHAHVLLVVDEAQTLDPTALEMLRILSNFEVKGRALLQVFLIGQTELRKLIINNRMEQLRQRIIASHRMEPMGDGESLAYIMHRLYAVGWDHDPELAPGIFSSIYRASGGVPRRINLIMDRLLLHGYLEELHHLDETALNVVLNEIRDEMPDMPQTLESPALPDASGPANRLSPSSQESQFETLESDVSNILLRLMRETIRIRKVMRLQKSVASATENTMTDNDQFPGSGKPENDEK